MSENIVKNIKIIESKVEKLIDENTSMKAKLKQYQDEFLMQQKMLNEEREKVKNLGNQIKINNIAKGNVEGGENAKEMRAKINEMIREIDKSIRYLKS